MPVWSWRVEAEDGRRTGIRADRLVHDALACGKGEWDSTPVELSRNRIQQLMREGCLTRDGRAVKPKDRITDGALLRLEVPEPRKSGIEPEEGGLEVLFEDEHLLVVNKPPGLTVHPSDTQMSGTLVNRLLAHVSDLSGIGGVERPGIVHRLDKHTSGVMVVAKSDPTHRRLVETFSRHEIERRYWALCYSVPRVRDGMIESSIGRNPSDRKKMAPDVPGGRRAVTHYRLLEAFGSEERRPFASLVEARLETGRTHQVRVHLTSLGCSLLGDPLYGVPTSRQEKWKALPEDVRGAMAALSGQALHARMLAFRHPITGEELCFEGEPPQEFRSLLEALQRYR